MRGHEGTAADPGALRAELRSAGCGQPLVHLPDPYRPAQPIPGPVPLRRRDRQHVSRETPGDHGEGTIIRFSGQRGKTLGCFCLRAALFFAPLTRASLSLSLFLSFACLQGQKVALHTKTLVRHVLGQPLPRAILGHILEAKFRRSASPRVAAAALTVSELVEDLLRQVTYSSCLPS